MEPRGDGHSHNLAIVLVLLLALSLYLNVHMVLSLQSLSSRVSELEEENMRLRAQVEYLNTTYRQYQQVEYAPSGWRQVYAVGVHLTESYATEGMVMKIYANVSPGSGRVFIATKPLIGIELQSSAELAFDVVSRILHFNKAGYDLYLVVEAEKQVDVVDGPSAGATIAALIAATILNANLNGSIVVTGTIEPDGAIGRVGGIAEKAVAAAQNGAKVFAVPRGQSKVSVITPVVYKPAPWIAIRSYKYEVVDLHEYLLSKGLSVEVVEVGSILDVLKLHGIELPRSSP